MVRAAGFVFSHTCNPVPCSPPPDPSEGHERGSSTTPLENLLLGYTKVLGAFNRRKYTCGLTIRRADGSFTDFQKALRVRLNIPKNEPLVVKQIDGDYTLDIETGAFLLGLCCLNFIESCGRGGVRGFLPCCQIRFSAAGLGQRRSERSVEGNPYLVCQLPF